MIYREIARKLAALSSHEIPRRVGGSHRKWHNLATSRTVPLPDWGSRDLKIGTVRAVVRQRGIDWVTFEGIAG
jgi:predicted RNA binding protein YcfA (HicA-like mRNA interferase family)